MSSNTTVANINTAIEKATSDITKALETCSFDMVQQMPMMQRAMVVASGIQAMRAALTDDVMKKLFMPLQGSRLGFRTDKDRDGGYPIDVVRDALIEAMIRGFQPVGNEFNIIATSCYITKEGLDRKVAEFPGITDLAFQPGVPNMSQNGGGALVPYHVTYRLNGVRCEIRRDLIKNADGSVSDQRIPVRVNGGMGADAILGKAKRKILAQLYDRLTGSKISTPDGDVLDTVGESVAEETKPPNEQKAGTDAQVDELVEKHKKQAAEAKKNGKATESAAAGQAKLPVDGDAPSASPDDDGR